MTSASADRKNIPISALRVSPSENRNHYAKEDFHASVQRFAVFIIKSAKHPLVPCRHAKSVAEMLLIMVAALWHKGCARYVTPRNSNLIALEGRAFTRACGGL
jgi:hypothetical protein